MNYINHAGCIIIVSITSLMALQPRSVHSSLSIPFNSSVSTSSDMSKEKYSLQSGGAPKKYLSCLRKDGLRNNSTQMEKCNFYDAQWNIIMDRTQYWIGSIDELGAAAPIPTTKSETYYNHLGKMDSSLSWTWITSKNEWIFSNKSNSTYNNMNKETERLCFQWDTTNKTWVNTSKDEFTYEPLSGKWNLHVASKWNDFRWQWVFNTKWETAYDENDSLILEKNFYWDTLNNSWIPRSQEEYTYDNHGNILTYTHFSWETFWKPSYKHEYSYDTNGNMLSCIYWQTLSVDISELILSNKEEKTYYANGRCSTWTQFAWDTLKSSWTPRTQKNYRYNGLGQILGMDKLYWNESSGIWEAGSGSESYLYDSTGHVVEYLVYGANNVDKQFTYSYDKDGYIVSEIEMGVYGAWGEKTTYSYIDSGTAKTVERPGGRAMLLFIKWIHERLNIRVSSNTIADIIIFDLSGRKLYSKSATLKRGINKINLPFFASGTFICRVKTAGVDMLIKAVK